MDIFILILLTFYSPLVRFSGGGECKDPSHFLFSGFVYSYLHNPFSSYTVNILNVSYYLPIERDLVQVGLMSKDPSSLQAKTAAAFKRGKPGPGGQRSRSLS